MKTKELFKKKARFLRESSNSTVIDDTLRKAAKVLALFNIPHLVCGGYAVQENGYPRFTQDIDIIVPNVAEAKEKLQMNGFKGNPGSNMTVTDRETKVEIDVLPGGKNVGPGPVNFPMPTEVSKFPIILNLSDLLSLKLSSYIGSPVNRAKDYGDVVELIKANNPPRNLKVDQKVKNLYEKTWDELYN